MTPSPPPPPIVDWFGTTLHAESLATGIRDAGLTQARLVIEDDAVVLEFSEGTETDDAPSRALTWLRTQFSPLVPATLSRTPGLERVEVLDSRKNPLRSIYFAELTDPEGFAATAASLLARAGTFDAVRGDDAEQTDQSFPTPLRQVLTDFRQVWAHVLTAHGAPSIPLRWWGGLGNDLSFTVETPQLLVWWRRGQKRGVAPAFVVALARSSGDASWLIRALGGSLTKREDLLLDGLVWGSSRRPTVAKDESRTAAILVDESRCDGCGICQSQCPVGYLDATGHPTTADLNACVRCFECVDACPTDALRPARAEDSTTSSRTLDHRPTWLSRLAGAAGPPSPATFTPSYLLARPEPSRSEPRVVLGLAVVTMQEHAAALVIDGVVVGAVEEEKLARDRHYGWRGAGRPSFVTPTVDPTICIEEVLCRRSIRWLLQDNDLTLDDVDVLAINGLHGRFRRVFSLTDDDDAVPHVRAGRVHYVPHHLCHAASAYRVSENDGGWILTADGRGDRETGAIFEVIDGAIVPRRTFLSLTDRSIGGAYEGVTRLLGFGPHGQGSVMALAGFGEPTFDMKAVLRVDDTGELHVHESAVNDRFEAFRREFEQPITVEQHNLAASMQRALEDAAIGILTPHIGEGPLTGLALAGGVALNCHMNDRLRRAFRPARVYAQPGANDGGTAIGAAAEAWWSERGEAKLAPMHSAALGPSTDNKTIRHVLESLSVPYRRVTSIAEEVAQRVADGQIVAWFQGALEFGPRALGGRSLIGDPRSAEVKDRLNAIKTRQEWRPFGPSILAGHEEEWFCDPLDSRFMLFTLRVLETQQHRVPAVMHVDGTTRPQVVHPESHPTYHAMISAFHELTNIPMVVNTSFNRRGEAVVASPTDALAAFWSLRADALALGPFIIDHPSPLRLGVTTPAVEPFRIPRSSENRTRLVLHSSVERLHDQRATPGAYQSTLGTLRRRNAHGYCSKIHVPLLGHTPEDLARIVLVAERFNSEVTFEYPSPPEDHYGVESTGWVSTAEALRTLQPALKLAARKDVTVEVLGIPLCIEAAAGLVSVKRRQERRSPTPPPPCRDCALLETCPGISPGHYEVFGSAGLRPVAR